MSNLMVFCIRFFGVLLFGLACVEAFGLPKEVKVIEGRDLDLGQYSSITTDQNGDYAVAFYNATDQDLMLLTFQSFIGYTSVTLDREGDIGKNISIKIHKGTGFPIVAYIGNDKLKSAICKNSNCSDYIIKEFNDSGLEKSPEIFFDKNNNPLFLNILRERDVEKTHDAVKCLDIFCENYNLEKVSGNVIGLNSEGFNIEFQERTSISGDEKLLFLVNCINAECSIYQQARIASTPNQGDQIFSHKLHINSEGEFYVAYIIYDTDSKGVAEMHVNIYKNGEHKALSTITSNGNIYDNYSLSEDIDGNLILSYYDLNNILYIYFKNELLELGSLGLYNDIALRNGKPIVSYYNSEENYLYVFSCRNNLCNQELVLYSKADANGDFGTKTDIIFYDESNIIVAYNSKHESGLENKFNVKSFNSKIAKIDKNDLSTKIIRTYDYGGDGIFSSIPLSLARKENFLNIISYTPNLSGMFSHVSETQKIDSIITTCDFFYFLCEEAGGNSILHAFGITVDSNLDNIPENTSFLNIDFIQNSQGDSFSLKYETYFFTERLEYDIGKKVSISNLEASFDSELPFDIKIFSLSLTKDGLPLIPYSYEGNLNIALCLTQTCDQYEIQPIQTGVSLTEITSDYKVEGYPVFSFYENVENKLKLYICDENCATYQIIEFDKQRNPVKDLYLKLNQYNAPVISFHDTTEQNLKLITCSNQICDDYAIIVVDDQGNTGHYNSLAIDENNKPIIAFHHVDTGQLKLAVCDTLTCNTLPTLETTRQFSLSDINEDIASTRPTSVDTILFSDGANPITDPDPQAQQGIAITAADQTNGHWQYSTDGQNYLNLPLNISETNAVLLADTTRIRFKPNPNYHGQAIFTFRAWDQTAGKNGAINQDLSNPASFISSAVSQESDTVTLTITPIANQPNVTDAVAELGQPNKDHLIITRHAADGEEVTHFKINNIKGGQLFKNDGTTPISNNSFITVAEGNAGLKFVPNTPEGGSFRIYAALNNTDDGVGNEFEIANISVDLPIVEIRTEGTLSENTPDEIAEFIFNLSLPAPTEGLTVYYQELKSGNNALLNTDYQGQLTGELHFSSGEDEKRITVRAIDDDLLDGDKALQLALIPTPDLTQRPRYTVSDANSTAGFVIEDNDAFNSAPYFKPKLLAQILNQYGNSTTVAVDNTVIFVINAIDNEAHPVNFNFLQQLPGAIWQRTSNPNEIQIEWTPPRVGQYPLTIQLIEETEEALRSQPETVLFDVAPALTLLDTKVSSNAIFTNNAPTVSGTLNRFPSRAKGKLIGKLGNLPITLQINTPSGDLQILTTQTQDDLGNFSFDALPVFIEAGEYFLTIDFKGTPNLKPSRRYHTVQAANNAGYALLVQGRLAGDEDGEKSHAKTLDRVYRRMRARGFAAENIEYLYFPREKNAVDIPDSPEFPTAASIQAALQRLQVRINADPGPLYLVFVDHGGLDHQGGQFFIDNGAEEFITPIQLDAWLTQIENGLNPIAKAHERVVILGSCYGGTFLPALSKNQRVIISSTAADEESFKGAKEPDKIRSGEFFIEALFAPLGRGYHLNQAFQIATESVETLTRIDNSGNFNSFYQDNARQHPLLDDNADQMGSNVLFYSADQDGEKSRKIYLGLGKTYDPNDPSNPIEIKKVTETQYLSANGEPAKPIFAVVNNAQRVKISVNIRAPNVALPQTVYEQNEQLEIPTDSLILLSQNPPPHEYANFFSEHYANFTLPGKYELFYLAVDSQDDTAAPLRRSIVYRDKLGNSAPSTVQLLKPSNGATTNTSVIFDWSDAWELDGDTITYTFELSTDPQFRTMSLLQEELPYSYTFIDSSTFISNSSDSGSYALQDDTQYFWRVLAIDEYGAHIKETEIFSFMTDDTNGLADSLSRNIASQVGKIANEKFKTEVDGVRLTSETVHAEGEQLNAMVPQNPMSVPSHLTVQADHLSLVDTQYAPRSETVPNNMGIAPSNNPSQHILPPPAIPAPESIIGFQQTTIEIDESNQDYTNIKISRMGHVGSVGIQYTITAHPDDIEFGTNTSYSGSFTWQHGETTPKTISLRPRQNQIVEAPKQVFINLMGPWGDTAIARLGINQLAVILKDSNYQGDTSAIGTQPPANDPYFPPAPIEPNYAYFDQPQYIVSEASKKALIDVLRKGTDYLQISYCLEPYTGSVLALPANDADYEQPVTSTVQWLANEQFAKTITIPIQDDTQIEGIEAFVLRICQGGFDKGYGDTTTIFIQDNDAAPLPPLTQLPLLGNGLHLLPIGQQDSFAQFYGGISVKGNDFNNPLTAIAGQIIDIQAAILPAPEHRQQPINILLAGIYQANPSDKGIYFIMQPEVQTWDLTSQNLKPFESYRILPETGLFELGSVFNIRIPEDASGTVQLYIGYHLTNTATSDYFGDIVYNADMPIVLTVKPLN